MIIDSHAHYNHGAFNNTIRYLTRGSDGFTLQEGDREEILRQLQASNIRCSIEPGISLESCREVLEMADKYPGQIFPAMGVHPTRCFLEKWSDRRRLAEYAKTPGVVAIGETGLDYHYKREEQHRRMQYLWFLYQLDLAWKLKKQVILHVRDAHEDALRILKIHPARKLGGVIHCFYGSWETAQQYLKLGYHVGIGGSILQPEERAGELWRAIEQIPLDRILVETDAPFILPYCKDVISGKALRRARNTSLILPVVIQKIAELKGLSADQVEDATAKNAIRLFQLHMDM